MHLQQIVQGNETRPTRDRAGNDDASGRRSSALLVESWVWQKKLQEVGRLPYDEFQGQQSPELRPVQLLRALARGSPWDGP